MKNLFFIFFCSFAIIATAQFRVQDNGIGAFGNLPSYFNAKSNLQDSVSSCCFFSPVQNAKARIAIGKYFAGKTPGIYIGEHTQNAMMLNLYGMLGFNFSFFGNDSIMYFNPKKGKHLQINCDVHTSGVLISSDERFKEDIQQINNTITDLSRLNAVSYRFKETNKQPTNQRSALTLALDTEGREATNIMNSFYENSSENTKRFGFIAQDVQKVYPELVKTDSLGYMYVDYIGIIPLLVNAISELNNKVDSLECIIQEQNVTSPISNLRKKEVKKTEDIEDVIYKDCELYQNAPNPFSSKTTIRCEIPEYAESAAIYVFNLQGRQLLYKPLHNRGDVSVSIDGSELQAGIYIYTLIVNNSEICSRRMILTE